MKKKILLISDDIRGSSGVSHISKNLILETSAIFDWVQMSAMVNHTESGTIVDVSESVNKVTNINNSYVRLYPTSGYGDEITLRNILNLENLDGILHISDPRNFEYLYQMDYEIRRKMPIMYYHVWDNFPTPYFNKYIYDSCDWIGCINKLTHEIVTEISPDTPSSYIPHGVSDTAFFKIPNFEQSRYQTNILGSSDYDFVIFSNNVNIPRKQLPLLLESVNSFCKTSQKKICLLMHNNR